ncbi:MAG: hypothetical protein ACRYG7_39825 [Janthinobacterium lividum]
MRFIHVLALVAGSLLTMSNRCKKDDAQPCPGAVVVASAQVPGLTPCITEPIPNVGQSNYYVVNSMAEYQELFACTPPPAVDFATHTLLAGKTRLASCGHVLAQEVMQTCAGYTYTVKLEAGVCQAVTNVVYYVLVPKIPSTTKVIFDVQLPPLEAKSVGLASEL